MPKTCLEVVHQGSLEVLDAALLPQGVAPIWVQLQGVVGLYLHQTAQELSTVLEVYPGFEITNKHMHIDDVCRNNFIYLFQTICDIYHLQFHAV